MTPWTIAPSVLLSPWDSPAKNTGVAISYVLAKRCFCHEVHADVYHMPLLLVIKGHSFIPLRAAHKLKRDGKTSHPISLIYKTIRERKLQPSRSQGPGLNGRRSRGRAGSRVKVHQDVPWGVGWPHLGGPELRRQKLARKGCWRDSVLTHSFLSLMWNQDPLILLELHCVCPAQAQLWDL